MNSFWFITLAASVVLLIATFAISDKFKTLKQILIGFFTCLTVISFFISIIVIGNMTSFNSEISDMACERIEIMAELNSFTDLNLISKKVNKAKYFNETLQTKKEIAKRGYFFIIYSNSKIFNIDEIPSELLDLNHYINKLKSEEIHKE